MIFARLRSIIGKSLKSRAIKKNGTTTIVMEWNGWKNKSQKPFHGRKILFVFGITFLFSSLTLFFKQFLSRILSFYKKLFKLSFSFSCFENIFKMRRGKKRKGKSWVFVVNFLFIYFDVFSFSTETDRHNGDWEHLITVESIRCKVHPIWNGFVCGGEMKNGMK